MSDDMFDLGTCDSCGSNMIEDPSRLLQTFAPWRRVKLLCETMLDDYDLDHSHGWFDCSDLPLYQLPKP